MNTTKEDSILVGCKSGSKVDKCEKALRGMRDTGGFFFNAVNNVTLFYNILNAVLMTTKLVYDVLPPLEKKEIER